VPNGIDAVNKRIPPEATASDGIHRVEVAGIEPASSVGSTGLLRVQSAVSLLGPAGLANEPA